MSIKIVVQDDIYMITGIPAGDDLELNMPITGIPAGQTLVEVWMTAKTKPTDADPGLFQKAITTTDVPGTGRITDNGAGDTVGAVRFDLTPTDTAKLVPTFEPNPLYFDVKAKTSTGKLYHAISPLSRISAVQQITRATS